MLKNTLFFLFLFLFGFSFSQQSIHGVITDRETKEPMPYVSVSLSNSKRGTISNAQGHFSFNLNQQDTSTYLLFTHIGYNILKVKITRTNFPVVVTMEQKINELSEVLIMPENSLAKLLKSAYEKIDENYPVSKTRYLGFYRESSKGESKEYLSYGEAYIEAIRGSINLKNDKGQIKILKSRGGYLPGAETTIHFYGGAFLSTQDFIQKRLNFIDPSHFNRYRYIIQKLDEYYKVSFSSKSEESGYSGYFILDPQSLAYLEAKYKRFGSYDLELFYDKKESEFYDKFIGIEGKYYLKYRNFNGSGIDKIKRTKIYYFDEYLSTEIYPNT